MGVWRPSSGFFCAGCLRVGCGFMRSFFWHCVCMVQHVLASFGMLALSRPFPMSILSMEAVEAFVRLEDCG